MNISRQALETESNRTGFRMDVLEKVAQHLNLLDNFRGHPFLKDRFALKGGTALNLFEYEAPRLSVDIDLNYIAAADKSEMQQDRPKIEKAIQAVCKREGFTIRRIPADHAGGKWRLQFKSELGEGGTLEIDVNFMLRVPLWPPVKRDSFPIGSFKVSDITTVDFHELAAGKLCALLSRREGRDLYDAQQILTAGNFDEGRLRLAFVVYGAMNRKDWRTVSAEDVDYDHKNLEDRLVPLLRGDFLGRQTFEHWAGQMVSECRKRLNVVLPFSERERKFLDLLNGDGKIDPELLTSDAELAERIRLHPMLEWKAINVRKHKGETGLT